MQINIFPHFSLITLFYHLFIKRVKIVSILNYIEYNKENSLNIIINELGYRPYAQKHYESVYTRFFQGYYLPEKFNFDKRRGHLSDLIRSSQLSRESALIEISDPPYKNSVTMNDDISFVIKKLGFSDEELQFLIQDKNKSYRDYKNSKDQITKYKKYYNKLRLTGIMSKWYTQISLKSGLAIGDPIY